MPDFNEAVLAKAKSANANELQAGVIVDDRFEIKSLLGKGGMCIVYKAVQLNSDRVVALKILHANLVTNAASVERFKREAVLASTLKHPNIVEIYGYGVWQGRPFVAMEYLQGCSLAEVLKAERKLPSERALPIFSQVCDALSVAHDKGIMHRDLKPSNVMLCGSSGVVKLVDFGIAHVLPESNLEMQQLIQTGAITGTVMYMSPEQCMAKRVDARSDVYAMGSLMYEVLTGRPPFEADSAFELIGKHLAETPPEMAGVDEQLTAVIHAALAKEPSDRPQTTEELKLLLLNRTKLVARRTSKLRFTRLPLALIIAVILPFAAFFLLAKQVQPTVPLEPPSSLDSAENHFRRGQLNECIKDLLAVRAGAGKNPQMLARIEYDLAEYYLHVNRWPEAQASAKAALNLVQPNSPEDRKYRLKLQKILTTSLTKNGDKNEALQSAFAFQKAAIEQKSPEDIALATAAIGQSLWQLQRYPEAMPYFEQSAELSKVVSAPLAAEAQNNLQIAKEGLQAMDKLKTQTPQLQTKPDLPQSGITVEHVQGEMKSIPSAMDVAAPTVEQPN